MSKLRQGGARAPARKEGRKEGRKDPARFGLPPRVAKVARVARVAADVGRSFRTAGIATQAASCPLIVPAYRDSDVAPGTLLAATQIRDASSRCFVEDREQGRASGRSRSLAPSLPLGMRPISRHLHGSGARRQGDGGRGADLFTDPGLVVVEQPGGLPRHRADHPMVQQTLGREPAHRHEAAVLLLPWHLGLPARLGERALELRPGEAEGWGGQRARSAFHTDRPQRRGGSGWTHRSACDGRRVCGGSDTRVRQRDSHEERWGGHQGEAPGCGRQNPALTIPNAASGDATAISSNLATPRSRWMRR